MTKKTKLCKKCGLERLLDDFPKDKSNPSGYHAHCKACRNAQKAARRKVLAEQEVADRRLIILEEKRQNLRSTANRNAILRLVKNHKAEFDAYVQAEFIKFRVTEEGMTPEKAWMSLAQ